MDYFESADPTLIWLAIICCFFTCGYIIKNELRSGSVFTFTNFVVVKAYIIPIVFVGTVAVSHKQGVGYKHLYAVRENIGEASILASVGLVFLFIGYILSDAGHNRSKLPKIVYGLGHRVLRIDFLLILFLVATLFLSVALSTGAKFGAFRSHGLENRGLLPIFAALNSVASFGLAASIASIHSHCTVRQRRFRLFLALYLGLICLGVGTRSALLDPLIVGMAAYFQSRQKSGIWVALVILPLLALFGIVSAGIRSAHESGGLSLVEIQYAFLYGSNFPDFRNLSMILGALDPPSEFAYFGKSIVSSMISFIPSGMLPWRAEFAWGNIVPNALNFNAQHHPGVRGLPFTEWYFNFGLVGLIVSSFCFGFILRLIGFSKNTTGNDRARYIIGGFLFYKFFGYLVTTTPNLASFYPVFFLFLFTLIVRKVSQSAALP